MIEKGVQARGAMGSAPSDWSGLTRLLPSADFVLDELQASCCGIETSSCATMLVLGLDAHKVATEGLSMFPRSGLKTFSTDGYPHSSAMQAVICYHRLRC